MKALTTVQEMTLNHINGPWDFIRKKSLQNYEINHLVGTGGYSIGSIRKTTFEILLRDGFIEQFLIPNMYTISSKGKKYLEDICLKY